MNMQSDGPLRVLEPEELKVLNSHIALLLNYSSPGPAAATLPTELKAKLTPETREYIKKRIASLIE